MSSFLSLIKSGVDQKKKFKYSECAIQREKKQDTGTQLSRKLLLYIQDMYLKTHRSKRKMSLLTNEFNRKFAKGVEKKD